MGKQNEKLLENMKELDKQKLMKLTVKIQVQWLE